MANICTIVNNIEASSYGELEAKEARFVIDTQPQKGDAPSPTNVFVFLSTNKYGTIGNVYELGQMQA
jgi:hypothetical protein